MAIQPLSTHDHLIKPNFCFIMNLTKLTLSFLLQSLRLLGCKNCIRWLILLSFCKSRVLIYFLLLNSHQRETSLHTWKVKTVPISIILRRYYFLCCFWSIWHSTELSILNYLFRNIHKISIFLTHFFIIYQTMSRKYLFYQTIPFLSCGFVFSGCWRV